MIKIDWNKLIYDHVWFGWIRVGINHHDISSTWHFLESEKWYWRQPR